MLMSAKERDQDHVTSMPAALITPALTRVAVSVVTWWVLTGARVRQPLCVFFYLCVCLWGKKKCPMQVFRNFSQRLFSMIIIYVFLMGLADVDECALAAVTGLQACQGEAECKNTPGSFTCSCHEGYVMATNGRGCVGEVNVEVWCAFW